MSASVLMVAAEASSALFAQRLLEEWQRQKVNVTAFGVGTREMEALGFQRLGRAEDMAVVGLAEIVSKYSDLKIVFNRLVEEAEKRRPQVAIVLDYPEFNLMLAKRLHALGIPVVYYVSPQVWAWRKGRVQTIKRYCENVFLLFPFEKRFYEEHQVPHTFIGHPLLDEVDPQLEDPVWRKTRKNQIGLQDDETVIGLMPGSRRQELEKVFSVQLAASRILAQKHQKLRFVILVAPTFDREDLLPYLEDVRFPYILLKDEPARMIAVTDLIFATSGTATLFVGLLKKPMVIMYRVNWLTAVIGRLIVRGLFGLPNLILGRKVVPELFQWDCTPEKAAQEMERYLTEPVYRQKVENELGEIRYQLGDRGATQRVVEALRKYVGGG